MWTEEEKELLRKHYPYMDNKELHQKYFSYRTVDQVVDHAIKVLKLKKDRKVYRQGWSEEQLEYLRINYEDPNTATAEMEKVLGKDISTIRAMARTMGLNRKRSGSWNREDKEKVFLYYPAMKTSELQKKYLPHKTERQIVGFANRNSILKSEEHLREVRLNQAFKNLEKIKSMSPEERKWGERVKVKCSFCDEDIVKLESKARKSDNHFCDYECMGQWMSENLKGKDNPNYGNGDAWTDEMRKASAKRVVKRLSDSDFKFHRTKPELTTEEILNDLKIPFKSEYDCEYYLIDKYLYEQDLMIEVQGNFFHCNPTMNLENSRETKILRKDTAKNTYIKKYYDIEILYLWEKDLKDDFDKCKKIVQLYIDKNGKLDNYHSFNYEVKNGELKLIDTLVEFSY